MGAAASFKTIVTICLAYLAPQRDAALLSGEAATPVPHFEFATDRYSAGHAIQRGTPPEAWLWYALVIEVVDVGEVVLQFRFSSGETSVKKKLELELTAARCNCGITIQPQRDTKCEPEENPSRPRPGPPRACEST